MSDPTLPADTDPCDEHSYDGIQEYDNPIPGWWKWLFIGTIIWSPLYLMWFHAPSAERRVADGYDRAYAENLRLQFGELGDLAADEATIARFINDEKWLAVGAATFQTNCVTCHGRDAGGGSGPSLTDDLFINIETLGDIGGILENGANAGAMPAWKNRLHPTELALTAAYVASLRGTSEVANYAGDPGEPIAPWNVPDVPEAPASGD